MARYWTEPLDPGKHLDRMQTCHVGGIGPKEPADTLIDRWVYFVEVCGFTFEFHSLAQIEECLQFFSQKTHPSSRRPAVTLEHYWQAWWERLPQWLFEEPKRQKVVKALQQAVMRFQRISPKRPINKLQKRNRLATGSEPAAGYALTMASRLLDSIYYYREPQRHYHDWKHIEHCLAEFQAVKDQCKDATAVEAAIWFHDAVYDPRRHDNEKRSAELAAETLRELGIPGDFIAKVKSLILATRHDKRPGTNDGRLLADIDLAILGQEPVIFDWYERMIRQEYTHVPDEAFARGRAAILKRFLERPRIYWTDYFFQKYEQQARENLQRSMQKLQKV